MHVKTVTFKTKDKTEFAATLRKNVNAYFKQNGISQKGNENMALKSVAMLSIYLIPFIMILTVPMSAWVILPLSIIMGVGLAGVGMSVMHDAVHGSYSSHKWVNKMMSCSMYVLGGNVFTWKIKHNVLHHAYTNIDGHDEDIQSRVILRFSQHAPLRKIHRFQHIYGPFLYCFLTLSMMMRDFGQLKRYKGMGMMHQQNTKPMPEYIKMFASKVIYLLVTIGLPILLTSFLWWQVVLGFLVVHMTAGFVMSVVFQLAHIVEGVEQPMPDINGNIENEWAIHQLHTTANFARNNRFLNWYVGGLNFQIEHHLFPNICHIHYKNISPIVEKTALEFGIPYTVVPTFNDAWMSHIRILKTLGHQEIGFYLNENKPAVV